MCSNPLAPRDEHNFRNHRASRGWHASFAIAHGLATSGDPGEGEIGAGGSNNGSGGARGSEPVEGFWQLAREDFDFTGLR